MGEDFCGTFYEAVGRIKEAKKVGNVELDEQEQSSEDEPILNDLMQSSG